MILAADPLSSYNFKTFPRRNAHQVGANDEVDLAANIAPLGQSSFQSPQVLGCKRFCWSTSWLISPDMSNHPGPKRLSLWVGTVRPKWSMQSIAALQIDLTMQVCVYSIYYMHVYQYIYIYYISIQLYIYTVLVHLILSASLIRIHRPIRNVNMPIAYKHNGPKIAALQVSILD